jgi:hypothetical protein
MMNHRIFWHHYRALRFTGELFATLLIAAACSYLILQMHW